MHELIAKVERWGNTIRESVDSSTRDSFVKQVFIQEVPDWATQIAQSIVIDGNLNNSGAGDRQGVGGAGQPAEEKPGCRNPEMCPHPFELALARFDGDESLLQMQIGFFLKETPEILGDLRAAIESNDGKALHLNAHRLKGVVRTYDDELAAELSTRLELMGNCDSFADAQPILALLTAQVDELSTRLQNFSEHVV
jgi:HPt (histidine-containing phosphotransfer) domain-containing protein